MEKTLEKKINKKAQVTIFIILAIAIVAIILVLLYPRIKVAISGPIAVDYIDKCIEDSTKEAIDIVKMQGGSVEPENYILYQGDKIEYSCYTNEYYKTCIMQKPFLKNDIESEITKYITPKIKECFSSLKQQLESKGSSVSLNLNEISVKTSVIPTYLLVEVDAPLTVSKSDGATSSFKKFNKDVKSDIYDLIMVASSISNWEARYGDSETMNFMAFYPNLKIEKKKQGDGTTIYILTNIISGDKFQFASRSLVFPPGYFGV